jgi:hypothetical protein
MEKNTHVCIHEYVSRKEWWISGYEYTRLLIMSIVSKQEENLKHFIFRIEHLYSFSILKISGILNWGEKTEKFRDITRVSDGAQEFFYRVSVGVSTVYKAVILSAWTTDALMHC